MTVDPKVVETVITGMTKGEVAAMIAIVIIAYSILIIVLGYIMKLHLKPLQGVPDQLSDLNAKVKSEKDLNLMIKAQVLDHALTCPGRLSCNINPKQKTKGD